MKWLKAGVMEDGELHETQRGTPQGGIISPLLANIYLHYVLDLWVLSWRKRHARGEVYIVRYADDFVMAFQNEQDARAMRKALAERLAQFGLELHPEKTRVIEFGRFAREDRAARGLAKPETFDFLGFTHIAGVSRAGKFQLKRRTSRKKRRAKLARSRKKCERRRHQRVAEQHRWLCIGAARGTTATTACRPTHAALAQFSLAVKLDVASVAATAKPASTMDHRTASRIRAALPTSASPHPSSLAQRHASLSVDPRWEPGAGNPLAGFCPGGGPKGPSLPGQVRKMEPSTHTTAPLTTTLLCLSAPLQGSPTRSY